MSKAEEFIKQHAKSGSNLSKSLTANIYGFEPWLTPDNVREVAKIVKEEVIEETCKWLKENICTAKTYTDKAGMQFTVKVDEIIEYYRKEMKGE